MSMSKARLLAEKLEISPKTLRAHLRAKYTRTAKLKSTSWDEVLSDDKIVAEVTNHFTKK